MVLLKSSEVRKHAPWILQPVYNMAAVVVGKGVGQGSPPLLFTLKAIPFQANSYDVAEFVCMVSIFWIVLPQFVIAMTVIFYSETSIKRTPN